MDNTTNQSDHDLLIQVNTKLEMLISTQGQYLNQYGKLLERVVQVEIDRTRDSTKIDELKSSVDDLRKKTNLVDVINAIAAGAAGVIGFIFGQR